MNYKKYLGETTYYDKKIKVELDKPKSWLKTISAFANTSGGKIFFGISDDDKLIGLNDFKNDSEKISELIKTQLDPIPKFEMNIVIGEEKNFIILEVFKGLQTPYYLVNNKTRNAYVRIGNESVIANNSQLNELVLKGFNKTFDSISSNFKFKETTFKILENYYFKQTNNEFKTKDFYSFSLVDKNNFLTYAGALFADQDLVYQSKVFCTRWNGLNKADSVLDSIDNKEYSGNILMLYDYTKSFILNNSKIMWKKLNNSRLELPDYPERAIQEAIVNALIHRNYSEVGSNIQIDMYDNRLEITSPGGMPDGSFVQNIDLYDISSTRRNPIIADLFNRMFLMERRGSGFKKIIESYMKQKFYNENYKPLFSSDENKFKIILWNLNYKKTITDNTFDFDNNKDFNTKDKIFFKPEVKKEQTGSKINISEVKLGSTGSKNKRPEVKKEQTGSKNVSKQKIMDFAKTVTSFSSKEVQIMLGLKSSRASELLQELVAENLIEHNGQFKNRSYWLKTKTTIN